METTEWTCDTCHEPITSVEHGWIEWLENDGKDEKPVYTGLRLVHAYSYSPRQPGRCQYSPHGQRAAKGMINDVAMQEFMGPDGLVDLLAMLADDYGKFSDPSEVLTLIQRLHIPGYERAFRHFRQAIDDGVFEPNTQVGFHSQQDIQAVNAWLDAKDRYHERTI